MAKIGPFSARFAANPWPAEQGIVGAKAGKSFSKTGNFYSLPRRPSAAILASLTGMICQHSPAAMINKLPWCCARSSIQRQLRRHSKGSQVAPGSVASSGRSPDITTRTASDIACGSRRRRQCWVKTRHAALKSPCSLFPQKRTLLGDSSMSALCQ